MATTTNYSWTTPDDTALVKDGAAAIRSLGTAIDTTTKALNPSTTLGDIEYRSSTANTNTRLGIGSTGQVLTVAGGVPSWATASAGGMTLISTTSLSTGTTTLSSIPQTYKSLFLIIQNSQWTGADGEIRALANGVTQFNTWSQITGSSASSVSLQRLSLTGGQNALLNGANMIFQLTYDNYTSTSAFKPLSFTARFLDNTSAERSVIGGGAFCKTDAITSIDITTNSPGTNTFSAGTALLYGVN